MSYCRGIIFIIAVCLSQILLTYLTMTLLPKLRKSKDSNYYRAAVLEAVPFSDSSLSIKEAVERNLETYHLAADVAHSNEVDMIVFPESTLFTDIDEYQFDRIDLIGSIAENIPNPYEGEYNPCDQESLFQRQWLLRNLSCLAKSSKMYIVANVVDYKICTNGGGGMDKNATINCSDKRECPPDGIYLYNTNVVFDKAGKLVARYHKKHLYFEPTMNPSKCPDNGFFNTEFGNFTTIICFDILFQEAEDSIESSYTVNLAYPYYWFDITPLLTFANIFQQGFAVYNKINVLASNGHVPGSGTVGSGIFSGNNGALISTHQPDGRTKLLISNVPKNPMEYISNLNELNRKRFQLENSTFFEVKLEDDYIFEEECEIKVVGPAKDMEKDYRCDSTNQINYKYKKLEKNNGTIKLCSDPFCCYVTYETNAMNEDYFVGVSATPFYLYETSDYSVNVCFLSRCTTSDDGSKCSSFVVKSETIFERVHLEGTFTNKYTYPFAVDSNIRLTKKDLWSYKRDQISYQNLGTNSSLLFLGLMGRDFSSEYS